MKKIGFFITARLKSSRLKRKILLDLNGKTVLDRVIERAKKVDGIENIVLCTSTNKQDAELFEYAQKNNIQFFKGSEDDVLKRLMNAAIKFGYDAFVSITADNPLFSIYSSTILVDLYKKNNYDFINTTGLPIGMNTSLFDVKALSVCVHIKEMSDTEIWGPFINQSDFFNVHELNLISEFDSKKRITLDYQEDYELFKEIYKSFDSNFIPTIFDILDILKFSPEIFEININKTQIMLDKKIERKIKDVFNSKRDLIKKYSNKIDKKFHPKYSLTQIKI